VSYRFLLEENIPRSIYRMLREKGFYVEYVPHGVDDDTVIRIAREKGLVLVTRDSDFADEVRYPPGTYPGIVVLRVHPPLPRILAERLAKILEELDKLEGQLVIVYNDDVVVIG